MKMNHSHNAEVESAFVGSDVDIIIIIINYYDDDI